ncbi:MAG: phage tail sheath subtilisin-like domain-containing protein [Alistipes sp.]|nr:phage tail sheath subtilisin-like domain-containing protein [Alistipes sp.]
MSADFLHGVEHVNVASSTVAINDVFTAVIGLVGTSDKGELNTLTLCQSEDDDLRFGTKGTIPEALAAIRQQDSKSGSALVFVVRVASDTDTVTGGMLVGGIDEDTGLRTGMQLFETAQTEFGYEPMIYIAPGYSALDAVKTELKRLADLNEAIAYIDLPDGMSYDDAIKSRAASGDFAGMNEGVKLLYPKVLIANPDYTDTDKEDEDAEPRYLPRPFSAFAAGLRARIDLEEGFHVSSSNHALIGVEGLTEKLSFGLSNKSSEVNMLNANGIVTAIMVSGTGYVEWGNYTAGFPNNADPEALECVRRTRAVLKRAIDTAAFKFMDKSISQAQVDLVRNSVNSYYNSLVGKGRIIYGKCEYNKDSNPTSELSLGRARFRIVFTPCIPMGHIIFEHEIDMSYLSMIK